MSHASRVSKCFAGRWLLALAAWGVALSAARSDVVINEIHYEPIEKTVFEEFIELYNNGPLEVDLSGWFFSSGVDFTFPGGTRLAPGQYLVVAESPETLLANYGVEALGPYEGRFANDGESVTLRNAGGGIEDEVSYGLGFPWPLAASGSGSSMELIHPSLDNDLGGSWRASGLIEGPEVERIYFLREAGEWRYRKATSEPSDPVDAWRQPGFVEDDTWSTGQTPIGFDDDDDNTVLDDMRRMYTGVYLRKEFTVDMPEEEFPSFLMLGMYIDDGMIVWINGIEVARQFVDEGEIPFDGVASQSGEAREYEPAVLVNPAGYLRQGTNTIAVHAMNRSLNGGDFSVDLNLFVPGSEDLKGAPAFPSPGAENTVYQENAAPQIRQVEHEPQQPMAGEPAVITAKVTDPQGVASVTVSYQVVLPGEYIPAFLPFNQQQLLSLQGRPDLEHEPNPEFEDPANWTQVAMRDDGQGPDVEAGDDIYTAVLPGQEHRTLMRYRIRVADTESFAATAPYQDDRSLNFAYFVYNGVPPYVASSRSVHPDGAGHVYSSELMDSLPVYHLITRKEDLDHCIAYNSSFQIPKSNENGRDEFNWEGAFVYEGFVYDHMRYRLRQANDRYGGSGKRSMRLRFNKGNRFRARDNYGKRYPERWRTVNTGKMFDNKDVGNFGLTEAMNANLWNAMGVPSPWFYTFHFRVIDDAEEVPAGATGQYLGDFWGMFSGIEDYDAVFMDGHALEDGNLYKLKDGQFDGNTFKRNQGRYAVTTDEDFQNIRRNLRPQQDVEWLNQHVNYDRWYPYHTVVEAIRHYDFVPADSHSKNRAWYFEPVYEDRGGSRFGRLWTLPWDSDASWGPNWNSGVDYSKQAIFSGQEREPFRQNYRNTIREFRDLLWTEEVIHQMIDDLAAFVEEFSMADRDRWRGAPAAAGSQDFGPMDRKVEDMKRFAFVGWSGSSGPTVPAGGRARYLDTLADSGGDRSRMPATPVVTSTSPEGFPIDALTFMTTPFEDPEMDGFAGMKWRIGEITPAGAAFDPQEPRVYEWPAVWETELGGFSEAIQIPRTAVEPGRTYRVRVRMRNETGRWSHWSEPAEFVAGAPLGPSAQETSLRVTEIMYNPQGDEDYEFIELQNAGGESLDLTDVRISGGIDFSFAESDVTTLDPGEYVVVAGNQSVFATRYDARAINVAGQYEGRLSNGGESIELVYGKSVVLAFEYDDAWIPETDGGGYSLTIRNAGAPPDSWGEAESWQPSSRVHGSPGSGDGAPVGGLQLAGNVNQDDSVNIGDAAALLRLLFEGGGARLPCGDGGFEEESNRTLLDVNGDESVNLNDAIHLLAYLFQRGAPPALGTRCVPIAGCPSVCGN